MRGRIFIVIAAVFACGLAFGGARPFVVPPGVEIRYETNEVAGAGWDAHGVVPLAFAAAKARLATAIAASGWRHRHVISLSADRVLDAWTRGDEELTVMIWRRSARETGFSYGVSRRRDGDVPRKERHGTL